MIHEYLTNRAYWAVGRTPEIIDQSIENSLCFGAYQGELQVGFARVVTDFSVFAWVLDLFILETHQGLGIGKQLIEAILGSDQLHAVKRWGLNTNDAQKLYEKYGFQTIKDPHIHMERVLK